MRSPLVTVELPAPAPGHDWGRVLSTSDRVRVLAARATLTSSATVATRNVALQIVDESGLTVWSGGVGATQAASLAAAYSWAHGPAETLQAAVSAGEQVSAALPRLWLEPGDSLGVSTGGLDAADQWSAVVVRYVAAEHWEHLQMWEQIARLVG